LCEDGCFCGTIWVGVGECIVTEEEEKEHDDFLEMEVTRGDSGKSLLGSKSFVHGVYLHFLWERCPECNGRMTNISIIPSKEIIGRCTWTSGCAGCGAYVYGVLFDPAVMMNTHSDGVINETIH